MNGNEINHNIGSDLLGKGCLVTGERVSVCAVLRCMLLVRLLQALISLIKLSLNCVGLFLLGGDV